MLNYLIEGSQIDRLLRIFFAFQFFRINFLEYIFVSCKLWVHFVEIIFVFHVFGLIFKHMFRVINNLLWFFQKLQKQEMLFYLKLQADLSKITKIALPSGCFWIWIFFKLYHIVKRAIIWINVWWIYLHILQY